MGSAVETLCGQAYGANKYEMLGIYLQRSTILLMLAGLPLLLLYIFSKQILLLLGESKSVASASALFVYGLIPQIFAYAAIFPIQKFLQSQSIVSPSAYISGVAVGCGWQKFVAYVNVGCYYVVGIPVGSLLGFKFRLGAKGIWLGMLGGTTMQTIILLWVTLRTNWDLEVEAAKTRLNKWQDKGGIVE